eukprot:TRINITY_DN16101_c0_g1_i1.p1 TRINITY_DN16101_c0_g1~~TRINITY_DN16101_c0_g1_i1.p1  ORF type:complete len:216 (+),score=32.72 TRINITY_DN16101_c0_g1_i1:141-788(+)
MTLGGDDFVKNLPNVGAIALWQVFIQRIGELGELVYVTEVAERHSMITIDEKKMWALVIFVYRHKLRGKLRRKAELEVDWEEENVTYEKLQEFSRTYKCKALWCVPAEEVAAKFRRVRWTMLYVYNGGNGKPHSVPNCLDTNPMDGKSIHGWAILSTNLRKDVTRTSSISTDPTCNCSEQRQPSGTAQALFYLPFIFLAVSLISKKLLPANTLPP